MKNIFTELQNSKSVLIMLPKNPYFDQVAAATSLSLLIQDKAQSTIHSDSPMLVEFNRLVGVDLVKSDLGAGSVVVRFAGYPAENIQKVSYDIEQGEMRLLVYLQPGSVAPSKDQVVTELEAINPDTVILIGGANQNHFPKLSDPTFSSVKLIHFGVSNLNLDSERVFDELGQSSSSISELLAIQAMDSGVKMNTDVATNLFSGIVDATRNFTSSSVTSSTFSISAKLLEKGARRDRAQVKPQNPQNNSVANSTPPADWMQPKIFKGGSN